MTIVLYSNTSVVSSFIDILEDPCWNTSGFFFHPGLQTNSLAQWNTHNIIYTHQLPLCLQPPIKNCWKQTRIFCKQLNNFSVFSFVCNFNILTGVVTLWHVNNNICFSFSVFSFVKDESWCSQVYGAAAQSKVCWSVEDSSSSPPHSLCSTRQPCQTTAGSGDRHDIEGLHY